MDQSDDRKRPSEDNGTPSGRPSKRVLSSSDSPASNPLNSSNASLPTDKDQNLLLFQNRAMKIRVEEQKHELNDKEHKIRNITGKLQTFEETISSLCRVWDQLNNGLHILSAKLDIDSPCVELIPNNNNETTTTTTTNGNGTTDTLTSSSSYNFLTTYISEPSPLDEDYTLETTLQTRIKKTQTTFSKIAESVLREHSLSCTLFRLLKSSKDIKSNDFERLLKEENERLSKHNQILQSAYDKLQIQIKHLNDQTSHLADQSTSYQTSVKELQQELDRTTDELNLERKRLIKMQDDIPKIPSIRLSSPNLPSTSLTNSSSGVGNQSNPTTPKGEAMNGKEPIAAPSQVVSGSIQQHEEFIEMQKLAEGRLQEARKLREEKANLTKEVFQLQFDMKNIPDERITNSVQFQMLQKRLAIVSDELDFKTRETGKLQHDIQQALVRSRMDREGIEQFEQGRRVAADRRVQQLEAEAIELKSEKEKLIEIIGQRNPNVPSQEFITEARLLLDSKDQEINKLKKEIEQLKSNIEKYNNSKKEIQMAEEKSNKQVEVKNLEIKDLIDKLREITRSNEELKLNEKKITEKERELQLSVELLKSGSSEQADVLDLRISENKLRNDMMELKKQVEAVEELKKKHVEDVKACEEKYKVTIRELEVSLAQSRSKEESHHQEVDALMEEIDSMGKEYEKMTEQNTRVLKQLSDKEDTHAHFMAENIKSQQSIRVAREDRAAMEEKVLRADDRVKQQNEVMTKIEEKSQLVQKQFAKATEELHMASGEFERLKRVLRERDAHTNELKTQVDHLTLQNQDLKKKADDSIYALEREIDKAKRLDEEKQQLKKKLEKASSIIPSSSSSSKAEEELKLINQRLRCTICNDRQKNYVIAKCFHVFCKECIYSNIDTRKRKCPSCMGNFSSSDVHQIYLT